MDFLSFALTSAIVLGTPLILAALGELVAERSGVINLSVEGMMLVGAATGFVVTFRTGNIALGFAAAALSGGALALVHAFLCVGLKANQIILVVLNRKSLPFYPLMPVLFHIFLNHRLFLNEIVYVNKRKV